MQETDNTKPVADYRLAPPRYFHTSHCKINTAILIGPFPKPITTVALVVGQSAACNHGTDTMVVVDLPRESRRWCLSKPLLLYSSVALLYAKRSGSLKRQAPWAQTCVLSNLGNGTDTRLICRLSASTSF
jgi:hypothetical protein